VPPFDTRLELSEATLEELRQRIAQYGLGAVLDRIRAITPHGRGRMKSSLDEERLEAMARHLAEDRDLPEAGRLSELARRAIRDFPRPSDLDEDGSPAPHAVKRLVKKSISFVSISTVAASIKASSWKANNETRNREMSRVGI
jgi:hypothetical protein